MTGWSAPAERTPFLMLTKEWTRLPFAPTCQIRTQMLTRIRKTVSAMHQLLPVGRYSQSIPKVPPMVGYHLQSCNQCISMDFPMINMPTKVYMQVHVSGQDTDQCTNTSTCVCANDLLLSVIRKTCCCQKNIPATYCIENTSWLKVSSQWRRSQKISNHVILVTWASDDCALHKN